MEAFEQRKDTDKANIHGQKAVNFYLPNPAGGIKTREGDKKFEEQMKGVNSLQLLDFDPNLGVYIGKTSANQAYG
jgi:hypothetical protein